MVWPEKAAYGSIMIREPCGNRRHKGSALRLASALLIAAVLGTSLPARAQSSIGEPLAAGDQLIFFFDTRNPRVTFVNVSNPADEAVTIEILIPAVDLRDEIELDALENRVIDPTALAPGQRGLLVLTPIVAADDHRPVVPPAPLLGNYTIANVELGAAFGGNALARRAVENDGDLAPAGSIVDGGAIEYQLVSPAALAIPVYFDPQTLGPPEQDGNRLQLAAFGDDYDGDYDLVPLPGDVEARFIDNAGVEVALRTVPLQDGLLDSDLETVAGTTLTSSGKAFLTFLPDGATGNFLGLFSQALGTFGAGGVLPELALSNGS
jgi:hypothetical protein